MSDVTQILSAIEGGDAQAATSDGGAESTCSELRNASSELESPVVCSSMPPI